MKKNFIVSVVYDNLILCAATISLNHVLEATGHGLDQISQVLDVVHLLSPQLQDLLPELLQVGAPGRLLQLVLHPHPHVLNGIEIWRERWLPSSCSPCPSSSSHCSSSKKIAKNSEIQKSNFV